MFAPQRDCFFGEGSFQKGRQSNRAGAWMGALGGWYANARNAGMCGWWKVKKSRKDVETPKSGVETGMVWFSPKFLKTLKKQFEAVKPETWHKVMNPTCGACLAERGRNPTNFQIKWVSGQNTHLGADVESANQNERHLIHPIAVRDVLADKDLQKLLSK